MSINFLVGFAVRHPLILRCGQISSMYACFVYESVCGRVKQKINWFFIVKEHLKFNWIQVYVAIFWSQWNLQLTRFTFMAHKKSKKPMGLPYLVVVLYFPKTALLEEIAVKMSKHFLCPISWTLSIAHCLFAWPLINLLILLYHLLILKLVSHWV